MKPIKYNIKNKKNWMRYKRKKLNEKKIHLATMIEARKSSDRRRNEGNHFVDVANNNAKQSISPKTSGCQEGEKGKIQWVGLRLSLTFGHLGCAILLYKGM
jgi:hypothetical protein